MVKQLPLYFNEQLLQYIWQFQYFNKSELRTTCNQQVNVQVAGVWNQHQGPDFSNAQILIGETLLVGSVELHMRTSDWIRHNHAGDPIYNTVVLHVVWHHDKTINNIPVLALEGRVPAHLLQLYQQLMLQSNFIPCENIFQLPSDLQWAGWRERLLLERMLHRQEDILQQLKFNHNNWEDLCWIMIARHFGMRLNADAFEAVARSLPLEKWMRLRHDTFTIEALLMGQAGMLSPSFTDHYPRSLQTTYRALQKKLNVQPITIPIVYLRMRPVNFAGIRFSQLAQLLHTQGSLFDIFKSSTDLKDVKQYLHLSASEYWNNHYRFDETSKLLPKQTGEMLINNIILNTAIPLLFTYAIYHKDQNLLHKVFTWLELLKPENNQVIHEYQRIGFPVTSAADSQALLEMKKEYCEKFRCLNCGIGNNLLRRQPAKS